MIVINDSLILLGWPYDRNIVTIVNYNRKTFIVQATGQQNRGQLSLVETW